MRKTFQKNWRLYFCEALGLAIFMISACFFGAMLEGKTVWHEAIPDSFLRMVITGVLMGATALFIFYSPFTSPSGAQINPAVTITFLRLNRISKWDAFFYVLFQITGGTLAVYIMAYFLKEPLTSLPVNYAATIPLAGVNKAFLTEFVIAFLMMTMILFTSAHKVLKKYTRLIAGLFVCLYVIFAGPISGFGMNPARSFASALPAHTWTAFWIYLFVPIAGMLLSAEFFLWVEKRRILRRNQKALRLYLEKYTSTRHIINN
ncbi:MAG: aquaporin [Flavisolibacter sp.]|nr:aquaporin [Flavisolibacter sp.]